jgi:hypothetical protein
MGTQESIAEHCAYCAQEFGLVGHPKLDALYKLAYDMGHAYGRGEVEYYFALMAGLLDTPTV